MPNNRKFKKRWKMNAKDYELLIEQFDLYHTSVDEIFDRLPTDELKRIMITLLHFSGLAGEVGELGEKIKKSIRDKQYMPLRDLSFAKELGDIEWYITRLETDFRFSKGEIMELNYEKLLKRLRENKLHGDGDNR